MCKLMVVVDRGFHLPLFSQVANAARCEPDTAQPERDSG